MGSGYGDFAMRSRAGVFAAVAVAAQWARNAWTYWHTPVVERTEKVAADTLKASAAASVTPLQEKRQVDKIPIIGAVLQASTVVAGVVGLVNDHPWTMIAAAIGAYALYRRYLAHSQGGQVTNRVEVHIHIADREVHVTSSSGEPPPVQSCRDKGGAADQRARSHRARRVRISRTD